MGKKTPEEIIHHKIVELRDDREKEKDERIKAGITCAIGVLGEVLMDIRNGG